MTYAPSEDSNQAGHQSDQSVRRPPEECFFKVQSEDSDQSSLSAQVIWLALSFSASFPDQGKRSLCEISCNYTSELRTIQMQCYMQCLLYSSIL